jgi:hypothetical protein
VSTSEAKGKARDMSIPRTWQKFWPDKRVMRKTVFRTEALAR